MNNIALQYKFERLSENFSFPSYWKDKKGRYVKVNRAFLADSRIQEAEIIGLTDKELWDSNAPFFSINDEKVINRERNEIFIEELIAKGNKNFYLSCKNPWYSSNGKLIGIYAASLLLNSNSALINSPCSEKFNQLLDIVQSAYSRDNHFLLTKRQKECLKCLATGMTLKQIGKTLGLSHKTVEHYLDNVKFKLHCSNRYELIKKAFALGLI